MVLESFSKEYYMTHAESERTKQNKNSQIFDILSTEKTTSGFCWFVQTTVDHFLFCSAAVLPDQLCTNSNQ